MPKRLLYLVSCKIDTIALGNNLDSQRLQVELQALQADIWALANSHQGDILGLLALLRSLEQAHRQIRENLFQPSLPDNRQKLYALIRNIEESGGWPYIERMKLRSLLENLPSLEISNPGSTD